MGASLRGEAPKSPIKLRPAGAETEPHVDRGAGGCLGVGRGSYLFEPWRGKHSMWAPRKELLLTTGLSPDTTAR